VSAAADGELRVCLYSPANLNIVSGSSVWVQAVAETLLAGPRVHVTLPLRCVERRPLITGPLRELDRLELVDPRRQRRFVPPGGLFAAEVLDLIEMLDRERRFDAILLRSFPYCRAAVERPSLRGRLWSTYVLEPERDVEDPRYLAELAAIAQSSAYVVVQSEEMRALFEALVPAGRGKTIILPPAVPAVPAGASDRPPLAGLVQRMCYAGKFHPFYPVPRMVDFLVALRRVYPRLEFHVIGDQIFRPPEDHAYADALEEALTTTEGVVWHGGLSRAETMGVLAEGGVALSLWDYRHGSNMNDLVVSTKLLDYCVAGLPVILNRTAAQETILGADYPLFVEQVDGALPLLEQVFGDAGLYEEAAARCRAAAEAFAYPRVYERLAPFLEHRPDAALRLFERPKLPGAESNLALLLAPQETDVPPSALRLLEAVRGLEPSFRLLVGRRNRSGDASPPAGADPAAALRAMLPEGLSVAVSTRTVEDAANWWRTAGFVIPAQDDAAIADPTLSEALASGAVPLLVGATDRADRLGAFVHATAESAAAYAASLLSSGGWAEAARRARALAFDGLAG
jgi:glycosyltransferase involved in cell wall biosynthesis